jgi:hypothetical protein
VHEDSSAMSNFMGMVPAPLSMYTDSVYSCANNSPPQSEG